MMDLPKPSIVRAQEIILAQMERLDRLAESWFTAEVVDRGDVTAISEAMVKLNRELHRTYPPLTYPPFTFPRSAD